MTQNTIVKFDTSMLKNVLNQLHLAQSAQTVIPILKGIRIMVIPKKQIIKLTSASDDVFAVKTLPVDGKQIIISGEKKVDLVLQGTQLLQIIKSFKNSTTMFEFTDDQDIVKITNDTSKFELAGLNGNNFPKMFDQDATKIGTFNLNDVTVAVNKVIGDAAVNNEARPLLNGIHVVTNKNKQLIIEATDSHVLGQLITNAKLEQTVDVTLPAGVVQKSLRMFKSNATDSKQTITLSAIEGDGAAFYCESNNLLIQMRTLVGNYPDISGIVGGVEDTQKESFVINADRHELLDTVNQAMIAAPDGVIELNMRVGGKLTFKASGQAHGQATFEADLTNIKISVNNDRPDVKMTTHFNAKLLKRVLTAFDTDKINFNISAPLRPASITSESDTNLLQIVTPVRTF